MTTYTVTGMTELIADQIFGDDRCNKYIDNIEALKGRYEAEHSITTGRHYQPGFIASTSLITNGTSNGTLAHAKNVSAVSRTGTGRHKFTLSINVPDHTPVLASYGKLSTSSGDAYIVTAWIKNEDDVSYVQLKCTDYNGTATDPTTTLGEFHIALTAPEISGTFRNSWVNMPSVSANDIMNYARYNAMVNNLQVLYDRINHNHTLSTGTHDTKGASLYCVGFSQGSSNPTSVSGYGYSSFTRVGTGHYRIVINTSILPNEARHPVFFVNEHSARIMTGMVLTSGGTLRIEIYTFNSSTGAASDINTGYYFGAIMLTNEDYN